jgi:hypothetical protein
VSSMVELGRHLEALAGAFGKPFGAKTGDQMLRGWYRSRALQQLPDSAVEWAVEQHIENGKKFPVPAEIVTLAKRAPSMGKLEVRAEIPSDRRCPECLEWWGVHRLVMSRDKNEPSVVTLGVVRHTEACSSAAWQRRWAHFYGYSWVDGPPNAGALEEGASAHLAPGAVQLIPQLPPAAHELAAARLAARKEAKAKASPGRNPYPQPKPPAPLEALIPDAQRKIYGGEFPEPAEELS